MPDSWMLNFNLSLESAPIAIQQRNLGVIQIGSIGPFMNCERKKVHIFLGIRPSKPESVYNSYARKENQGISPN